MIFHVSRCFESLFGGKSWTRESWFFSVFFLIVDYCFLCNRSYCSCGDEWNCKIDSFIAPTVMTGVAWWWKIEPMKFLEPTVNDIVCLATTSLSSYCYILSDFRVHLKSRQKYKNIESFVEFFRLTQAAKAKRDTDYQLTQKASAEKMSTDDLINYAKEFLSWKNMRRRRNCKSSKCQKCQRIPWILRFFSDISASLTFYFFSLYVKHRKGGERCQKLE